MKTPSAKIGALCAMIIVATLVHIWRLADTRATASGQTDKRVVVQKSELAAKPSPAPLEIHPVSSKGATSARSPATEQNCLGLADVNAEELAVIEKATDRSRQETFRTYASYSRIVSISPQKVVIEVQLPPEEADRLETALREEIRAAVSPSTFAKLEAQSYLAQERFQQNFFARERTTFEITSGGSDFASSATVGVKVSGTYNLKDHPELGLCFYSVGGAWIMEQFLGRYHDLARLTLALGSGSDQPPE